MMITAIALIGELIRGATNRPPHPSSGASPAPISPTFSNGSATGLTTRRPRDRPPQTRIASMRLVFVLDCQDPDRLALFWIEAIGYRRSDSAEPYVVLIDANRAGPDIVLQRVAEPKIGKNRMHLDIRVEDLDNEVARLTSLGARQLYSEIIEEAGFRWMVMADPEGNEFCVGTEPSNT
jgi:predicted enzyme related to lactoylglutathione lyase